MSSTSSSSTTSSRRNTRKKKKSVTDRTQEEFRSLVQDVIQTTVDAGPRAAITRSLDAYRAVALTARDFVLPTTSSSNSSTPGAAEPFSTPVALRKMFERLGATYIKLGQFVASSPTLFPAEYVREFQKCLDQTEALPWRTVERVLKEELCTSNGSGSRSLSQIFSHIDRNPLASASIAQVHRATLRSTGQEVVLKVQKPGIDASLKADLGFVYASSRILEFLQPDFERTSLSAVAGDLRASMLEELDFVQESRNVEEFANFLREQGLDDVATTPKIYKELTTKKVLTMEFLDGVSLLDPDQVSDILQQTNKNNNNNSNMESVIITALNVWTTSVLTMPFFHADVHAGNLLLLKNDGRVGFIDFGIVGKVSPSTFEAVTDLSGALAASDYEGMARALCNMGATEEEVDVVAFGRDLERLLNNLGAVQPDVLLDASMQAVSVSVEETEVTELLLDMVRVTEDNGLRLPREFGLLVKQSLYFDRYLKILAPGIDVMSDDRVSGLANGAGDDNNRVLNSSSDGVVDATVIDVIP